MECSLPIKLQSNLLSISDDESKSLSNRLTLTRQLFEIASGQSQVQHPLCSTCSQEIIETLEEKLSYLQQELSEYQSLLGTIPSNNETDAAENNDQRVNTSTDTVKQPLADKEAEESEDAQRTLNDLLKEKKELEKEYLDLVKELEEVEEEENSHWLEINQFEALCLDVSSEMTSLNVQLKNAQNQLDRLKKTNVYNDTFKITHDGPFGMINGQRLGRLPDHVFEWSEINAAVGQALFLLDTLSKKCNFTFKNYKLIPCGSFSKIEKLDGDKSVFECFGSSDFTGLLFWNRRFDSGLAAFLNCIQQLGDYAERSDPKFRLPYRINKDKIGDVSIKMQFNQDELWTKAMKYLLINLKWLAGFVSMNSK
jgi:beclin 1